MPSGVRGMSDTSGQNEPTGDGPEVVTAAERAILQEIYQGAADAGVRIAGITQLDEIKESVRGSKDAPPVRVGERTTATIRVGRDGRLLPRRGDSDEAATSLLRIQVYPEVLWDSDGDQHIVWIAYASQVDVATARVFATSLSHPSREEMADLEGGRPSHVYGDDPEYQDGLLARMPKTRAEAVRRALVPLVGGADTLVSGHLVRPPAASTEGAEPGTEAETGEEHKTDVDSVPVEEELVEADLPGFEPDRPTEAAEEELVEDDLPGLTEADLDDWFEGDVPDGFGGHERFKELFMERHWDDEAGEFKVWEIEIDDLAFGVRAYKALTLSFGQGDDYGAWLRLGHEAKERFRLGWEEYVVSLSQPDDLAVPEEKSVIPELASIVVDMPGPDALLEVDPDERLEPVGPGRASPTVPRWIFVGGGFGVLGLILAVGFFVFSGSDSSDIDAAPPLTSGVAAQDVEIPEEIVTEIAPPGYTADEVMVDLALQSLLGISVVEEDFIPFLGDPTLPDIFALPEVDSLLRTSFFAETLDELGLENNLGPVPTLTHAGSAWLTFDEPVEDPQAVIFDRYQAMADIVFPPGALSNIPAQNMLVVAVRIDADLTDPAVCSGKELVLVLNIDNPAWGNQYVASERFPGEYYAGGNFFPNFNLSDCTPVSYADTSTSDGIISGLANSGAALLTVNDGVTHGVILLSDETVNAEGSLYTILFEHPVGETFFPENTRYQSAPDILGPSALISDGITTGLFDFTLVPQTTVSVPTEVPPTVTPVAGTDAGDSGGETVEQPATAAGGDPDQTRSFIPLVIILVGLATAILGAYLFLTGKGPQWTPGRAEDDSGYTATSDADAGDAFRSVQGTGEPGSMLEVEITDHGWGTPFGSGGTTTHTVIVGEEGSWSLGLGEVADGHYTIKVQDVKHVEPPVTFDWHIWIDPDSRAFQQTLYSTPGPATGPPPLPPTPATPMPAGDYQITVGPGAQETEVFQVVGGTGEPGSPLIVTVQTEEWGTSGASSTEHDVTVGEDGTWNLDLGELKDGKYTISIQDPEARHAPVEIETRIWVDPDTRQNQRDDRKRPPAVGPQSGRWIGAGVGAVAFAVGAFFLFTNNGDPTPLPGTEQEAGVAQTDTPSSGPGADDVSEVEESASAEAIAEPAPQVAVEEEPGAAVEDEAQVAVDDPVALVTIVEATVLADPVGDVWIEVSFAAPWLLGRPGTDAAWNMIVQVGIAHGEQFNGTQWSLVDGKTRGEGFIAGDVRAALDGEMWVTEEGKLVVKPPGLSPTGGLPASDLGPDATIYLFGQLILEEGDEIQRREETTPLGEVTQLTDPLPRSDWPPVETDFGPVTLVIPGGEGSGG